MSRDTDREDRYLFLRNDRRGSIELFQIYKKMT
jgi:hypothetical protein